MMSWQMPRRKVHLPVQVPSGDWLCCSECGWGCICGVVSHSCPAGRCLMIANSPVPGPAPAVKSAEKGGKIHGRQAPMKALLEVASLIFVAEWGDRSMLATIALGAVQSPLGVAGGAIVGHAVATLIAVIGGAVLSKHISERTVAFLSGVLFLVFAGASIMGVA